MVNRKLERRLVMVGSIWQIVSGLLTIFVYASYIKNEGLNSDYNTLAKLEAAQSIFGSLYMFSVSFGMLFVILGIVNFVMAKLLKDNQLEVKKPIWFILIGVTSYLVMDLLGSLMFLSAGILALAKNKSISKIVNNQFQKQ
ncbi:hypothetical protein FHY44_06970 [Bacillus sp. D12]|uniref:hypothetical protein n=1 Tax=Bacillus sp. D12 TaxID=336280 RepID=UPI00080AFAFE|nr:hypothetical protein [Bacillus sp. D12]OCA83404.1 hypothetical protein A8L44_11215 [Bacillus sp. FJAT-27986]TPF73435.1 hypothetical protein FHY44_06970 [Bacillus sp. D12]